MDKTYIAIDLEQFHSNQEKSFTKAQMLFISADNINKAKEHLKEFYPSVPWTVIPKSTFDKNIVYKSDSQEATI